MHDGLELDAIRRPLEGLRRSLRLWQLGVGVSRCLGLLAILILFSLVLDRGLRMDHIQRVVALLLGVAAMGAAVWRWIVRPLRRPMSDVTLLRQVEHLRPEWKDRLVAAWEFAAMTAPPPGASPVFFEAAIRRGIAAASQADFRGVLDWSRFRRHTRVGVVALAALVTVAALDPHALQTWFARNVLLSRVEWPRRTQLIVQDLTDGVLRVPAAADLALVVRAEGVPPASVVLHYTADSGVNYTEQMPRIGETYRTVFRNVTEPFRLQVLGGDGQTPWIPVRVLPRPAITNLTVTLEPPAYTGLKPVTTGERVTSCRVPAGSRVLLNGCATLPLRGVEVLAEKTRLPSLALDGVVAFSVTLPPDQVKSATFRLLAVSADGVPALNPAVIGLRVEPDRPPRVAAALEGIGQLVLARAVVPVACELQDDYGVEAAWLEYQSQSPVSGGNSALQTPIPLPREAATGAVVRVTQTLDLAPLRLEPDTTLSLRAAARDGNPVNGPGQSQSGSFTLRVVTDEELRQDFARRERMLRLRLDPLIQEQALLADEARLFHAGLEDLKEQAAWRTLQVEKRQRQVAPALVAILNGLAQIRNEAHQNRLEPEPEPLCRRLDTSALAPLRKVIAEPLPEAVALVTAARRQTGPEERRAAWREAEAAQRRVAAALGGVRNSLLVSSDVGDLVRLMDDILSEQKRVNQETQRKAADAIETIFETK
jgi:hypothetical protein